jgi:hypothetical protein
MDKLDEVVIKLHDCARALEREFGGEGALSNDIRDCADRLTRIINDKVTAPKKN